MNDKNLLKMITRYIAGNCKIDIEKKKANDEEIKNYINSLPFKIVVYNKDNQSLKNLSAFDSIDNIRDYKRMYGKKSYFTFPIKIEGETSIRIDDDVLVEDSKDGVMAVSKRYMRTFFPELKTALSKDVKFKGRQICDNFITSSLSSIINREYYNVTLYEGDNIQNLNMVFADDTLVLRRYITNNLVLSSNSMRELINEIK